MFKVKKNENCYRCFNESTEVFCAKNNKNRILEIKLCVDCRRFFELVNIVKDIVFIHYNKYYLVNRSTM